ncbi:MAG: hypothetical protein QOD69_777 [Solirubrobacteraceae bacterium]|nr:hypothetical protein [Solirubrobacteraceae bacterium]
MGNRRRLAERVPLLLWTAPLAALMVGAIVAVAEIGKGWALALACLALVATAAAMAIVTRSFLLDEEDVDPQATTASARRPALALAAIAAAAIAVAFLGSRHDDVAAATSSDTSVAAEQTVRDFLVAAYVGGDGEAACGYLSLGEQRQAAHSGRSTSCRDVLDDAAGPPELAALTSPRQVRDLPARVQLAGRGATVRLGGAVFLLRPATAAEQSQFDAAPGYWRIASGVTALLRAG